MSNPSPPIQYSYKKAGYFYQKKEPKILFQVGIIDSIHNRKQQEAPQINHLNDNGRSNKGHISPTSTMFKKAMGHIWYTNIDSSIIIAYLRSAANTQDLRACPRSTRKYQFLSPS